MKAFIELVQYLFTIPGVKCFLSGWLSQDTVEKFFGCQRQRGKSGDNPNEYEFCKNTQALRVINSVCGNVPRGNCRGNKSRIDWEAESKPLPKRRKAGKENHLPSPSVCNQVMPCNPRAERITTSLCDQRLLCKSETEPLHVISNCHPNLSSRELQHLYVISNCQPS